MGWLAVFGVIVLALAPVSAALHLSAPAVRRGLMDVASGTASGLVNGRIALRGMHPPSIDELRFDEFRVEDPETGAAHLRLEDVRIRPSWGESVSALGLVLHSARVGGGELDFRIRGDGQVGLAALLQSPSKQPAGSRRGDAHPRSKDTGPGTSIIWLRQVRFDGLELGVMPASGPTIRFTGLSGGSQIRLKRRDSVRVQAWDVGGTLRSAAVPASPIELRGGKVWVDAGVDVIAEAQATVHAVGGDFPVTYAHDKTRAVGCLCVGRRDLEPKTRLALGLANLVMKASQAGGLQMAMTDELGQPTMSCCGG